MFLEMTARVLTGFCRRETVEPEASWRRQNEAGVPRAALSLATGASRQPLLQQGTCRAPARPSAAATGHEWLSSTCVRN